MILGAYINTTIMDENFGFNREIDDGYLFELKQRHIKLAICVTAYNEPWELLEKTMGGIMDNIYELETE